MRYLDKVKMAVEDKEGFQHDYLALAELAESADRKRWIVTFFYSLPGQETYSEAEFFKDNGQVVSCRRLEL